MLAATADKPPRMRNENEKQGPEFLGIHLLDAATGKYFRKLGEWVEERSNAKGFMSAAEAIELAYRASLENVELLVTFLLPTYREVRLPISKY